MRKPWITEETFIKITDKDKDTIEYIGTNRLYRMMDKTERDEFLSQYYEKNSIKSKRKRNFEFLCTCNGEIPLILSSKGETVFFKNKTDGAHKHSPECNHHNEQDGEAIEHIGDGQELTSIVNVKWTQKSERNTNSDSMRTNEEPKDKATRSKTYKSIPFNQFAWYLTTEVQAICLGAHHNKNKDFNIKDFQINDMLRSVFHKAERTILRSDKIKLSDILATSHSQHGIKVFAGKLAKKGHNMFIFGIIEEITRTEDKNLLKVRIKTGWSEDGLIFLIDKNYISELFDPNKNRVAKSDGVTRISSCLIDCNDRIRTNTGWFYKIRTLCPVPVSRTGLPIESTNHLAIYEAIYQQGLSAYIPTWPRKSFNGFIPSAIIKTKNIETILEIFETPTNEVELKNRNERIKHFSSLINNPASSKKAFMYWDTSECLPKINTISEQQ